MISLEMLNAVAADWAGHMLAALVDSALILLVAAVIWWLVRQRASAQFGYWLFLLVPLRLLVPIDLTVPAWVAPLSPRQLLNTTADRILPLAGGSYPRGLTPGFYGHRSEPHRASSDSPLAYQSPDGYRRQRRGVMAARSQLEGISLQAETTVSPAESQAPLSSLERISWQAVLMLGWLAVVLGLLGRWVVQQLRVRRLLRSGMVLDSSDLPVDLQVLATAAGLGRAPEVLLTDVASPAVCGVFRPRLLVPADLLTFAARQVAWILLHELAHIRRRDMLVGVLQRWLQALHFFNPAAWMASWMVDQLREYACDDAALAASGASRRICGEGFLNVALRASGHPMLGGTPTGLLNRSGVVHRRLVRILDSKRKISVGLSAGAGALLVVLGALMIPTVHASPQGEGSAVEPAAPIAPTGPAVRSTAVEGVSAAASSPVTREVSPAPALKLGRMLQAPEGAKATWEALRGKVVMLEFWATWCGPCVATIPHLNELAEEFRDKPVQVIAITNEPEETVKGFLQKRSINAWIGLDGEDAAFSAYGVTTIPHTVLVDQQGNVAAVTKPGEVTSQLLQDLLAGKTISLPRPSAPREGSKAAEEEKPQPKVAEAVARIVIGPASRASGMSAGPGEWTYTGASVRDLVLWAYRGNQVTAEWRGDVPEDRYDVTINMPKERGDRSRSMLQGLLREVFGINAHKQPQQRDVFVLSVPKGTQATLTPSNSRGMSDWMDRRGKFRGVGMNVFDLARQMSDGLDCPVIDETGIRGQYDFDFAWDPNDFQSLVKALREKYGLELAAATREVPVLIVEGEATPTSQPTTQPANRSLVEIVIQQSTATRGRMSGEPGHETHTAWMLDGLVINAYGSHEYDTQWRVSLPPTRYDVNITVPPSREKHIRPLLQCLLREVFGIGGRREPQPRDVMVMTVPAGTKHTLTPATSPSLAITGGNGRFHAINCTVGLFAANMGYRFDCPVIDQTGIEGRYEFDIQWDAKDPGSLVKVVREKFGLELTAATRDIDILVVEDADAPASQPTAMQPTAGK